MIYKNESPVLHAILTDVSFTEEHHTTIAAGQSSPHGPELEPIDPSYVGRDVVVNKVKGNKIPFEEVDIN